ncbi:putative MFS family arabinose efflux permease [Actinoplanes campanulatus]|uniref:Putative MFS family arabinose efflux permease n=1 Tax=Actinoplanes campanulatus TaxID=113559 RepID=A0A7W5AKS8_9ACTN|nr:MFS transporter [Actinoplanes campanulatus]MBB3097926.1 putative MFS family arabinose efflux permease [Actinoplanes campanulatus]GGN22828.1 membrane protein [Actinoplanes campanulatus]GID34615.1 membrane protein [Actinoplanes campanulatus]
MRTYGELFRTPEFSAVFFAYSGQIAAQTVSGLALGTLIYTATGSPLLSALAMFGPSLAQLIGASTLLSGADRLPPRTVLTGMSLVFALSTAAQAIPGLPVWVVFTILFGQGMIAALGGGVSFGLLNEILPGNGYVLGTSVLSLATGVMQIGGYAVGGVLVTSLSPRVALLIGAALHVIAAVVARAGLSDRPPRASGRISAGETWRNNVRLWSDKGRRYVYLSFWIPCGLVVGCESLYVSYSPRYAGAMFAFGAFGMLVGDVLTGRLLTPRQRGRIGVPLLLLLAVPHLAFAWRLSLPAALAAVMLAAIGYSANWVLQERLISLTPADLTGQALGLYTSGMRAAQGCGAALAGAVAEVSSPSTGIVASAVAAVLSILILAPALRVTSSLPVGAGDDGDR